METDPYLLVRDRQGMFAGTPEQIAAHYRAGIQRIAANPPQVLRWTKQLLQQARTSTLDEALDAAGQLQGQAHHSADHHEAVAAFFEKRVPRFGP